VNWTRIGLALAVVGLAGSLAGLMLADALPFWWWSELLQHPRLQLLGGSLLCALFAALLSRWRWRWLAFALPLWALGGLLPALWQAAPTVARDADLRVAVANVHSANPDPAAAVAAILALDADVVAVLETTGPWGPFLAPLRRAYPVRVELPRDDNFGICLYARRGRAEAWQPDGVEVPGIVLAIDDVELLAVHPPPPFSADYQRMWRSELAAVAAWARPRRAVVIGDLNATPWSAAFRALCRDGGVRGPGGLSALSPTWMRGTVLGAPIDHVLLGDGLAYTGHAVGGDIRSDHRPVVAGIAVERIAGAGIIASGSAARRDAPGTGR
jgi:endonuclease/exonuclease/phosphatase (EEP) superfamily protein YafD